MSLPQIMLKFFFIDGNFQFKIKTNNLEFLNLKTLNLAYKK